MEMPALNWSQAERDCFLGYAHGHDSDYPEPGDNNSRAYVHGFENGRDDSGIRKHGQTAQERRDAWAQIVKDTAE